MRPTLHVSALDPALSSLLRDSALLRLPSLLWNCNFASQLFIPICSYICSNVSQLLKTPFTYSSLQLLIYVSSVTVQFLEGVSCTRSSHVLNFASQCALMSPLTTLPKLFSRQKLKASKSSYLLFGPILPVLSIAFDTVQILSSEKCSSLGFLAATLSIFLQLLESPNRSIWG